MQNLTFRAPIAALALAAAAAFGAPPAARADSVPPQLDAASFAACLLERDSSFDLARIQQDYGFSNLDLLLLHLSVYPGRRLPWIGLAQDLAQARWSGGFADRELGLARALDARAAAAASGAIVPGELFADALSACGADDVFCAALLAHNVLRTLGRNAQAVARDPDTGAATDYNPDWFKGDRAFWLAESPRIQGALASLLADGGGDRWGEWYHFFGILAYGIHEAAQSDDVLSVDLVTRLNGLLNPILAGDAEEPAKARLDRDSAEVAHAFVLRQGLGRSARCAERAGYVAH